MISAHTRALAFVSHRILACGGTFLLFAKWLEDVDVTVAFKCAIYEVVEPSFRQFPEASVRHPRRLYSSAILEPLSIVVGIRKSNA